ncbi:sigma-54 interaction domain-containing protein [Roseibium aggregatum]|uniref:Transcriptional regulatory protein ZraR n=1 Tax=Roseibium aggregatum TaxID=187304 RepID=A0A0M6YCQ7_9HYPH|nr:sigma 54-interacting transcriptional regulator [Roseibium aggregatum]CTQ47458.1 Transcriptional regulatory protein ZraR [Roseibium aggregatum]
MGRSDVTSTETPAGPVTSPFQSAASAFSLFAKMSEGTVAIDRSGRITWLNGKYRRLLGIADDTVVEQRPIEQIIPESRLREVAESGRPVLLDIMRFGDQHFVVCRLPLRDANDQITGAVGFVFFDRLDYLKPILSKFNRLERELEARRAELAKARRARYSLSGFIGVSKAVRDLKTRARRIAQREGAVLLLGETGVGKELLAQGIHEASPLAAKPFVAVNVAAVPETLMESEFFGVAPGAFTGADRRPRPGKFEIANGGTLFLDEIGDMPLSIQAKFLRVLQEGEIEALGSNDIKHIDVRVIAATSGDLEKKVREGTFRADLFYRLAVLPVSVPPLRERPEDIEHLAERILDELPRGEGLAAWILTDAALQLLRRYDWPGNVRELQNVLERATIEAESELLDAREIGLAVPSGRNVATPAMNDQDSLNLAETLKMAERAALADAIDRSNGDKTEAARLLGISRSSLYSKLKTTGMDG